MIIDTIENIQEYAFLGPNFVKAAEFVASGAYKTLPLGKTLVDEDRVFCIISEADLDTFPVKWEIHRKYADIQIPIEGAEAIGCFPLKDLKESYAFPEDKDIVFFTGYEGQDITVKEGEFMILLPQDVHRPCCPTTIARHEKKAVIKVLL